MLKNFSEEQFDIIIQAGQSNCEGYGFGYVDNPYQPYGKLSFCSKLMILF